MSIVVTAPHAACAQDSPHERTCDRAAERMALKLRADHVFVNRAVQRDDIDMNRPMARGTAFRREIAATPARVLIDVHSFPLYSFGRADVVIMEREPTPAVTQLMDAYLWPVVYRIGLHGTWMRGDAALNSITTDAEARGAAVVFLLEVSEALSDAELDAVAAAINEWAAQTKYISAEMSSAFASDHGRAMQDIDALLSDGTSVIVPIDSALGSTVEQCPHLREALAKYKHAQGHYVFPKEMAYSLAAKQYGISTGSLEDGRRLQVDDIGANKASRGATLYDRLGGVYAIAAVVNLFSDELLKNPVHVQNPQLAAWDSETRLPGLKFMRTLWLCDVAGGPLKFVSSVGGQGLNLKNAHCPFKISPSEFTEVARVLQQSMEYYKVPAKEQGEVLAAFKAHMGEVTACH